MTIACRSHAVVHEIMHEASRALVICSTSSGCPVSSIPHRAPSGEDMARAAARDGTFDADFDVTAWT